MKQKYSRNHKVEVFQNNEIITLQIFEKYLATTDYYWPLFMIKNVSYKRKYRIQTKFDLLKCLYSTIEPNVVPLVDENIFRL